MQTCGQLSHYVACLVCCAMMQSAYDASNRPLLCHSTILNQTDLVFATALDGGKLFYKSKLMCPMCGWCLAYSNSALKCFWWCKAPAPLKQNGVNSTCTNCNSPVKELHAYHCMACKISFPVKKMALHLDAESARRAFVVITE